MGKNVRYWISFVAMFSVLLHAAFVARHNQSLIVLALADPLTIDFSTICAVVPNDSGTTDLPEPNKTVNNCPICMGAAPAVALANAAEPALEAPALVGLKLAFNSDRIAPRVLATLPPSRGPPLFG